MFASRYFAAHYFAPRYFPRGVSGAPAALTDYRLLWTGADPGLLWS